MTEEKADPKITTEYRGKTVAFCCDRCLAKFRADPEKYLGRLPQFADPVPQATASTHEHPVPGADPHGSSGEEMDVEASAGHAQLEDHHARQDGESEREPLLGRLHPIIVHFPLAGIPLAFLGFLAWTITGREAFAKADVLPLFAASLAAIAAVITGNIAHDAMRFSEALHRIVERHQLVATSAMVLSIGLSLLRIWRWNRLTGWWRRLYGLGLLIGCVLLAITGFLGGSLVFGPDHLSL
jgi:uncharacterized membrane protein/YHS domain-containing protein